MVEMQGRITQDKAREMRARMKREIIRLEKGSRVVEERKRRTRKDMRKDKKKTRRRRQNVTDRSTT